MTLARVLALSALLLPAGTDSAVDLPAARARWTGDRIGLRGDPPYLAGWTDPRDRVSWEFDVVKSGAYIIVVEYAAPDGRGGGTYDVEVAGQVREGFVHETGADDVFLPQPLMTAVRLDAGKNRLTIAPRKAPRGLVMNLKRVRLAPDLAGG